MNIRLEYKGRVIQEVDMAQMVDEITIGRSQGCTWITPKEDGLASSKHASLQRKGKSVYVKDLDSTNGLYFQGRRIKQKKLEDGDRLTLGDCLLVAEEREESHASSQPSRLVVLSGPAKGQRRDILPPKLTIGSSPTSDLGIMDMLVSKNHAEVVVKEGGCWIRDLGSKNGTSVNGVALRGDQDRMLKDSDRISIAQFEIVFQDGAVKRTDSKVWLRVGVIVATLAVVMAGYWLFQQTRPSAGSYLERARRLATTESFSSARLAIEKSKSARKANRYENERSDLSRLVDQWENTLSLWTKAKKNLEGSDWVEASRNLGTLAAADHNAWSWKKEAVAEREEAKLAKLLIDIYNRAQTVKRQRDIDVPEWQRQAEAVTKARSDVSGRNQAYLAPLMVEFEKLGQELAGVIGEDQKLARALATLEQPMPSFPPVLQAIDTAVGSRTEALRIRAELLKDPVRALGRGYEMLQQATDQLRDLKFNEARASVITLPTVESCAIDPAVSNARARLDQSIKAMRMTADQLRGYFDNVRKATGAEPSGPLPAVLLFWKDEAVLPKVFACDSLDGPLPKRSRQGPEGRYDEAVGIEPFYDYLRGLPDSITLDPFNDTTFDPVIIRAGKAVRQMELCLAYVNSEPNRFLLKDGTPLATAASFMSKSLEERDAIVAAMWARAQKATGREAIIAGGIALCLSSKPGNLKSADGQAGPVWIAARLKELRKTIQDLDNEFGRALPERQIVIRGQVMATGLPGDPVVRRMWAARDSVQTGSAKP